MYVPVWVIVAAFCFYVLTRLYRRWSAKLELRALHYFWLRLSHARRAEVLYVRERIHLHGASGVSNYAAMSDAELQACFENAIQNSKNGDGWAFELLKEQVFTQFEPHRIPETQRPLRPQEPRTGVGTRPGSASGA